MDETTCSFRNMRFSTKQNKMIFLVLACFVSSLFAVAVMSLSRNGEMNVLLFLSLHCAQYTASQWKNNTLEMSSLNNLCVSRRMPDKMCVCVCWRSNNSIWWKKEGCTDATAVTCIIQNTRRKVRMWRHFFFFIRNTLQREQELLPDN